MNVNTKFNDAPKNAPVVIEQVFAEKPGGGMISAPSYDIPQGTAVYASGTKFLPIKGYRLTKAVGVDDTTIQIAKGSGIAVGDKIGHAQKSVACTAVSTTNADYDVVTVTLGVAIAKGVVLYEAATASANAAVPKSSNPLFVTGNDVKGGEGDKAVRLINGANLRKETAPIAEEVAALIPTINLV